MDRKNAVKQRNPYAVVLRRMGQKVKPSKKVYTRKGRSKDRPFGVSAGAARHTVPSTGVRTAAPLC